MACGFTSGWQSWVQLENMSAWHNQEFATKSNGFGGLDATLVFNTEMMVRHIAKLSSWVKSGLFHLRRQGERARGEILRRRLRHADQFFRRYANIKRNASLNSACRSCPTTPRSKARRRIRSSAR